MKARILLLAALTATAFLGGCMSAPGNGADDGPRVREFDLVVHQGLSDTVELYEKNDGNYSKVVAITFQEPGAEQQAMPGPEIRVKEGDTVVIRVVNPNALTHTLHLHGGLIPWEMDGVDHLTQAPIPQGGEFTYTFPNLKAGTYWYHCHVDASHHIDFGLYGALVVEERSPAIPFDRDYVVFLDEVDNCHVHGNTDPVYTGPGQSSQESTPDTQTQSQCYYRFLLDNLAQNRAVTTTGQAVNDTVQRPVGGADCPVLEQAVAGVPEPGRTNLLTAAGCAPAHAHGTPPPQQAPRKWWPDTHPVYNPLYNTFLVNGKAFPDSPVFPVKQGETVRFRIINAGNQVHTWHPHGHTMLITHKDGYPLTGGPQPMDTLAIAPGERFDYVMEMDNPGLWMVHDQMGQYAANDDTHPGGIMACMAYDGFGGAPAFSFTRSLDCHTYAMEHILKDHQHGA